MKVLPIPTADRDAVEAFVAEHLGHLVSDDVVGSPTFRGGQRAANDALAAFDVEGYARHRNDVLPRSRRGASGLSPYIRHGLLPLSRVWRHVAGGPDHDVRRFRDELLWQEFARHWYARLGRKTRRGVHNELPPTASSSDTSRSDTSGSDTFGGESSGWDTEMACISATVGELHRDGWLVNQARMWLASQWAVRDGLAWRDGEDEFFRHLLDGSRAANRLGWQWTTGVGSNKHYGFSRYQVEQRAGALCNMCDLERWCPIEDWPDNPPLTPVEEPVELRTDPHGRWTVGPSHLVKNRVPDLVWLTAESLGDADPALAANPDLPVVFVFDEPLLAGLRLSSKRLVFLTETLAELAETRELALVLGHPVTELAVRNVAVTFAPVPGFRKRAEAIVPAEVHPWPWLAKPSDGVLTSFSAWRRSITVVRSS